MKLLLLAAFHSLGLAGFAFTNSGLNHAVHAREFPLERKRGAAGGQPLHCVGLFTKQLSPKTGFISGKNGECGSGGEEKTPGQKGR